MSDRNLSVDATRIAMLIRKRGGYVLPEHEAQMIALVLDNMIGRAEFLFQCMQRAQTPTESSFDAFMEGWNQEVHGD